MQSYHNNILTSVFVLIGDECQVSHITEELLPVEKSCWLGEGLMDKEGIGGGEQKMLWGGVSGVARG